MWRSSMMITHQCSVPGEQRAGQSMLALACAGLIERSVMTDPIAAGPIAQGQAPSMQVTARLDAATYRPGSPLGLTLELAIDPGFHIYGQPIPEGFIPVSVAVAPLAGLSVGAPVFPTPTLHRLEGLEEEFYIYEGVIQVMLPLTFATAAADNTLTVTIGYQACNDAVGCLMPQQITVHLPVQATGEHVS